MRFIPNQDPAYLPELWKRALAHAGIAVAAFEPAPPDGYTFLDPIETGLATFTLRRDWLDARLLEMLDAK